MCAHAVGKFYKRSVKEDKICEAKTTLNEKNFSTESERNEKRKLIELSLSSATSAPKKKCCLVPDRLWRLFPRQQKAFDLSRSCHQSSAVFAVESEELGTTGQRRYLVTTYYEFGQRYFNYLFGNDVAVDSACRLYFDIEYKTELNPQTNSTTALETFIQYIFYQLYKSYELHCDRSHVLDLDSTTPSKFSRHLIFHLPHAVFKSNIHAGNFVHYCCDQLRAFCAVLDSGEDLQQPYNQHFPVTVRKGRKQDSLPLCPTGLELTSLFVTNEQGKRILLCDEGVYTRNRNFRLYLSSKLGKGVPLLVAKESCFKSSYCEDTVQKRRSQRFNTLMDSLVCNVSFDNCSRVLEFSSAKQKQTERSVTVSHCESGDCGPSPFPLVDAHITSTLTRGGALGSIRRWTYFSQGKQVIYDIQHNRWCENIGRAHKSNNIMIVADLMRGAFYQKCHDPDCKKANFRGNEKPLPPECNPVVKQPHIDESSELHTLLGDITDREVQEMEADALDTEKLIGRCPSHDSMDGLMLEALARFEDQSTAMSSTQSETDFNISVDEMNSFCEDINDV